MSKEPYKTNTKKDPKIQAMMDKKKPGQSRAKLRVSICPNNYTTDLRTRQQ